VDLPGLKPRCQEGFIPSGGKGAPASLYFPVSRGCSHSLTLGLLLHLQGQQSGINSLPVATFLLLSHLPLPLLRTLLITEGLSG